MQIPQLNTNWRQKQQPNGPTWRIAHITGMQKGFPLPAEDMQVTLITEKRGILGTGEFLFVTIPVAVLYTYYTPVLSK